MRVPRCGTRPPARSALPGSPGAGPEEAGAGAGAGREGPAQGRATCPAALIAPAQRARRRCTMSSPEHTVGTRRVAGGGRCRRVPLALLRWDPRAAGALREFASPSLHPSGRRGWQRCHSHPRSASRTCPAVPTPRVPSGIAPRSWLFGCLVPRCKELVRRSPPPSGSQHRCTGSALERARHSAAILAGAQLS